MAELGVAASGIAIASIAIQVGDSILKFKTFWDNVKEAPEEIKFLIEEIETLSLVLSDVDSSKAADDLPQLEPASANRCLELCRKGAGILETVVRELNTEIRKRKKVGSFKAVLKRGTIERLKERLQSAQFMLMLSNQTYAEALQKQRHELQRQWAEVQQQELADLKASVSHSTDVVLSLRTPPNHKMLLEPNHGSLPPNTKSPKPTPNARSLEQTVARVKKAQTRQRSFIAKLSAPRWLSMTSRALEISGAKAPFGWNFSIRTYNIVSHNGPLIKHARCGELSQIQKLLTEGKASLYDRTEYGEGILDVATINGRLELVKFLMSQNASFFQLRISTLCHVPRNAHRYTHNEHIDFLRLLVSNLALDDLSPCQALYELTSWYWGDPEVLSWIINQLGCSFQQLSQRERIRYSANILSWTSAAGHTFQPDAAGLVWLFIENKKFDSATCCTTDRFGISLLHGIAWNLNLVVNEQFHEKLVTRAYADDDIDLLDSWVRERSSELLLMFGELVSADPTRLHGLAWRFSLICDPHWYSPSSLQTPFMTVIYGAIHGHFINVWPKSRKEKRTTALQAISAVLIWLEQLKRAGIDLVEYGRKEREMHIQRQVSKEWPMFSELWLRLISFTYGPEPSDWQFWFTEVMENYFLCFWDMVDHPERTLPGAWIEDLSEIYMDGIYDPEFDEEAIEEDCDIVE